MPPGEYGGTVQAATGSLLSILSKGAIALAAVRKEWKNQGEREKQGRESQASGHEHSQRNWETQHNFGDTGESALSLWGRLKRGCREIKGKSQAGVCFQADKLEFYLERHAERMDFSVLESAVRFTLVEIRKAVSHRADAHKPGANRNKFWLKCCLFPKPNVHQFYIKCLSLSKTE